MSDVGVKCVVACVDFSSQTEEVLRCAVAIAGPASAEIVVLHVAPPEPDFVGYEPGPQSVRNAVAAHLKEEHRRLHEIVASLSPSIRARPLMGMGPTALTIVHHVTSLGADLVIIGSHGHGALHHLLTGSVTKEVLKKAPVPVVVVPPRRSSA